MLKFCSMAGLHAESTKALEPSLQTGKLGKPTPPPPQLFEHVIIILLLSFRDEITLLKKGCREKTKAVLVRAWPVDHYVSRIGLAGDKKKKKKKKKKKSSLLLLINFILNREFCPLFIVDFCPDCRDCYSVLKKKKNENKEKANQLESRNRSSKAHKYQLRHIPAFVLPTGNPTLALCAAVTTCTCLQNCTDRLDGRTYLTTIWISYFFNLFLTLPLTEQSLASS